MNALCRCNVFQWIMGVAVLIFFTQAAFGGDPIYAKLILRNARILIGPVINETADDITVVHIPTGERITTAHADVIKSYRNVSESTVMANVGLPPFLAWKVRDSLRFGEGGKIANIDDERIYITCGSEGGAKLGQKLVIERKGELITEPDTGTPLGESSILLGELEINAVHPKFAECRVTGNLVSPLKVGDFVRPDHGPGPIVVLPLVDARGLESEMSRALSEAIITGLVKDDVVVVERNLLSKVLSELALQNSSLVPAGETQRIGQLVGAEAVLTGTYEMRGENVAELRVRLLEVSSAKVLFAVSHTYRVPNGVGLSVESSADLTVNEVHKSPLVAKLLTGVWRIKWQRNGIEHREMRFRSDNSWSAVETEGKSRNKREGKWVVDGDGVRITEIRKDKAGELLELTTTIRLENGVLLCEHGSRPKGQAEFVSKNQGVAEKEE